MTSERVRYFIYGRGIPSAHYRIRAQETTLDDYTVRAPFSGQLVSASVEPGTYVQPGAPLATLSRTDVFEFRAAIPESEANRMAVVRLFHCPN
ncbi:HlyD family efflux transporter periplasmic adaptor subunit [Neolewinella persica]|uniref:HlyD family efflux transporter periplasmic adaptor subunit n=1 Tax=Neolewinella persica TaxID=70998 RepID=UPI000362F5C2|nr:HlyD family efflux transporter periplasmic adaptor subunit [Neolewinella persica]